MGFFNGRISGIKRFKIEEGISIPYDEAIMKGAFRNFFPENATHNVGFVSINDCLDSDLTEDKTLLADFRVFSFRIDRRVIPPSTLKIRMLEREKEFLEETGQKRLYREQRADIKEAIEIALLKTIPPVTDIYDVAINTAAGIVYFSTLSNTAIDKFSDAFKAAFGFYLQPYEVLTKEESEKATGATTAPVGRDFLAWLWFKSQQDDGKVAIDQHSFTTVNFNNRVVFEFEGGELTETVCCTGRDLDSIKEAKESFRQGKKIKDARITIENENSDNWAFSYKGDSLQFQSVKLPMTADTDEETPEGRNLDRLFLMTSLTDTMDNLLKNYVDLRLSEEWPAEVSAMQEWAEED